jgi:hypothetical protein
MTVLIWLTFVQREGVLRTSMFALQASSRRSMLADGTMRAVAAV